MPRTTRALEPIRETSSAASRDFPTPGSPTTVTSRHRRAAPTASNARAEQIQVLVATGERRRRATCDRSESGHLVQAIRSHRLGLALGAERLDCLDAHHVANETEGRLAEQHLARPGRLLQPCGHVHRIARHERLPARRVAGHDLSGVDADAEARSAYRTAARTPRLTNASRACISSAARQARSASSSCASGTPKTANTASPTNFSTVPPCRSSAPRISWKYESIRLRTVSASTCSPNAVDPERSQKTSVASFRRSLAGAVRAAPQ